MGTRADFYIGMGDEAKWLGSIAWDGYPDGIDEEVLAARSEEEYETAVVKFMTGREDSSGPDHGWPWPWNDSRTTDYAYTWNEETGNVWISKFGRAWVPVARYMMLTDEQREEYADSSVRAEVPDMSKYKNVTFGARSGLIVIPSNDQ